MVISALLEMSYKISQDHARLTGRVFTLYNRNYDNKFMVYVSL